MILDIKEDTSQSKMDPKIRQVTAARPAQQGQRFVGVALEIKLRGQQLETGRWQGQPPCLAAQGPQCRGVPGNGRDPKLDRKSTRLNSSHRR